MPARGSAAGIPVPRRAGRDRQFESSGQELQAVRIGMWIFLSSEILFFGAAIGAFVVYRLFYSKAYMAASVRLGGEPGPCLEPVRGLAAPACPKGRGP